MKEDIEFPKVERVGVCAIPQESDGKTYWKVQVINMLDKPITNVLVAAKGYGKKESKEVATSELRHYFEEIPSKSLKSVEVIPDDLVGLSNQYWVSFYIDSEIFDKKFIFLPETLIEKNLTHIPIIDQLGILII